MPDQLVAIRARLDVLEARQDALERVVSAYLERELDLTIEKILDMEGSA